MVYRTSQLQISGARPPYDNRNVFVNGKLANRDMDVIISSGKSVKIMLVAWNEGWNMTQPEELTVHVGNFEDRSDSTVVSFGSVKCILQSS